MIIKSIDIQCDGYVHCKSSVYSVQDSLSNNSNYSFFQGINRLIGEIDSGNWASSYMISMHGHRPGDFVMFDKPRIMVNGESIALTELSDYSCYMDELYPLFSGNKSIKWLITQGLKKSGVNWSIEDIINLLRLDSNRIERPLKTVGNERFRAMAAIGLANGKEIFCFPWMSHKRFLYYHDNIEFLLKILEDLNKVVILPIGKS